VTKQIKQISQFHLDNDGNRCKIQGKPVFKDDYMYVPVGAAGVSILKYNSAGSMEEVGRWGRKTTRFPSAQLPPFTASIFITDLQVTGDYLVAYDRVVPVVYFLKIDTDGIPYFSNYVRIPTDYRSRPGDKERKVELFTPVRMVGSVTHMVHYVEIQKLHTNQDVTGDWFLKCNVLPKVVTNDFDVVNKVAGEDWSLDVTAETISLPSATNPLDTLAFGPKFNIQENFFTSPMPQRFLSASDNSQTWFAFSLNQTGDPFDLSASRAVVTTIESSTSLENFTTRANITIEGAPAGSQDNYVSALLEEGDYLYVALAGDFVKVVKKTDLDGAIIHTLSNQPDPVLDLGKSDNYIYALTDQNVLVCEQAANGSLTQITQKACTGAKFLHVVDDNNLLIFGTTTITGAAYGQSSVAAQLDQPDADILQRPYKRPGWFMTPLMQNFEVESGCGFVASYGDGTMQISLDNNEPDLAAPTHQEGSESVSITPAKAILYSATNILEIFQELFKDFRGRLTGLDFEETADEFIRLNPGSLAYDGQIIESDSIEKIDTPGKIADSYVYYDDGDESIKFEETGPALATVATLATYDGNDWVLADMGALTPILQTKTPNRIFYDENNVYQIF